MSNRCLSWDPYGIPVVTITLSLLAKEFIMPKGEHALMLNAVKTAPNKTFNAALIFRDTQNIVLWMRENHPKSLT